MIVLRSPKGWTGPKVVDGKKTEGTVRSHQVPMGDMSHPGHVKILEKWLKSYRPQELFDQTGKLRSELAFAVFWTSQKFPTLEHNHHPPESA